MLAGGGDKEMIASLYRLAAQIALAGQNINSAEPAVNGKNCLGIHLNQIHSKHFGNFRIDNVCNGVSGVLFRDGIYPVGIQGVCQRHALILETIKHFFKAQTLVAHGIGHLKSRGSNPFRPDGVISGFLDLHQEATCTDSMGNTAPDDIGIPGFYPNLVETV